MGLLFDIGMTELCLAARRLRRAASLESLANTHRGVRRSECHRCCIAGYAAEIAGVRMLLRREAPFARLDVAIRR
jgi:hypothetical protein